MPEQGWDLAEFHCGRCGTTVSATTEAEYLALVPRHQAICAAAEELARQILRRQQ